MRIAYALREEFRGGNYLGGVLAAGTSSIDVAAELEANDGLVLVDEHDHLKLAVLDDYPALERSGERPDAPAGQPAVGESPAASAPPAGETPAEPKPQVPDESGIRTSSSAPRAPRQSTPIEER